MTSPASQASAAFPTIPRGEVIGRYENYLDAQKVVDYLADHDFPVVNVSIIGNDLKLVERVRGKLSYPRVAGQGAAQGAMLGVFFGLLLMLFSQPGQGSAVPLLAAVLLGAFLFMIMGVVSYALQRGKRDFSSTRQVLPSTWDVVVEHAVAAQARQLVAQLPMNPSQAGARSPWGQAPTAPPPAQGQQNTQPQPAAPAPAPAAGYGDLDDGRPRYGVRLEPTAPEGTQAEGKPVSERQAEAPTAPEAPAAPAAPAPGEDTPGEGK
ncbi:MAG: ECF transporter S component [Arthrobacter sp.]|jgi:hypothetical protein|nr:ECF transporter S component [Arthrobacter sp.]